MVPPFSGFCMLTGCENHRPKGPKQHTHTCSEISYRIVDVECIGRAKNTPVKLNRRNEIYIYINGTMVAYTGPGEVSSLVTDPPGTDPPGTPVTPCNAENRSFTSIQMVHTHMPRHSGAHEMTMKMK